MTCVRTQTHSPLHLYLCEAFLYLYYITQLPTQTLPANPLTLTPT